MAEWPKLALGVWMTQEQEALKVERVLRNLLLLHNPDAQSSVWATPPRLRNMYRNLFGQDLLPGNMEHLRGGGGT